MRSSLAIVHVKRAEGPSELCGIQRHFSTWEEVRGYFYANEHTFPKNRSDKHDFFVRWKDGTIFEGCLPVTHPYSVSFVPADLATHIKRICEGVIARGSVPSLIDFAKHILENCCLSDDQGDVI